METTPGFCAGCFAQAPDRAWTDAAQNAQMLDADTQTVLRYLRSRKGVYPVMSSQFDAIATHYEQIAELILPAIDSYTPAHYRNFIGDLDKQKEHARRALRPIKDEMARAADEIENALAAMG